MVVKVLPATKWFRAPSVKKFSVRAKVPSKGTICVESIDHPFAQGHLPREHGTGSLGTLRRSKGAIQRDVGASGLSVRARTPSRGCMMRGSSVLSDCARVSSGRTWCGKSHDYLFTRGHLPTLHGAGSLRTIRSCDSAF